MAVSALRCLLLATVLSCAMLPIMAPDAGGQARKLSNNEQAKLAQELYRTMAATDPDKTDVFVALHTRVINECPDTRYAEESLWRLSNLYLYGMGNEPEFDKIILFLERLTQAYPKSPLAPDARNRLRFAYEKTGRWKQALPLYEILLNEEEAAKKDASSYAAILIGYAEALANTGQTGKAKGIFERVLELEGASADPFLMEIARDRLSELTEKPAARDTKGP